MTHTISIPNKNESQEYKKLFAHKCTAQWLQSNPRPWTFISPKFTRKHIKLLTKIMFQFSIILLEHNETP